MCSALNGVIGITSKEMAQRQDLCFQRGSRPEQSDQATPDQPAELDPQAGHSYDSLLLADRIRFKIGTAGSDLARGTVAGQKTEDAR